MPLVCASGVPPMIAMAGNSLRTHARGVRCVSTFTPVRFATSSGVYSAKSARFPVAASTSQSRGPSECEDSFGSRIYRYPLVRIRSGLRHSRFDLYEFPTMPRLPLSHFAVAHVLRYRGIPRTEEVRPKEMTYRDCAMSNVGSCSCPKLCKLARRKTWSSNGSKFTGAAAP